MTAEISKEKLDTLFEKPSQNPLSAISIRPRGVRFESQNRGEEVYILLRQHWVTNIPWILKVVIGLFALIVSFGIYFSGKYPQLSDYLAVNQILAIGAVLYTLISSYAFISFLRWYFNAYIVTNERLLDLDYNGISQHRISEANLLNIEDVSSGHIGIWQNLFDFGNVQIQTAAERLEFVFEGVPNPGYVQDKIMDMAHVLKGRSA